MNRPLGLSRALENRRRNPLQIPAQEVELFVQPWSSGKRGI